MIWKQISHRPKLVLALAGVKGATTSIHTQGAGVPFRRARQRQNAPCASVSVTAAHQQTIDFITRKGGCCPNAAH
jgi:hypothetical protein